jgi:hypothetical protein
MSVVGQETVNELCQQTFVYSCKIRGWFALDTITR